jgi:hypothetical protein
MNGIFDPLAGHRLDPPTLCDLHRQQVYSLAPLGGR